MTDVFAEAGLQRMVHAGKRNRHLRRLLAVLFRDAGVPVRSDGSSATLLGLRGISIRGGSPRKTGVPGTPHDAFPAQVGYTTALRAWRDYDPRTIHILVEMDIDHVQDSIAHLYVRDLAPMLALFVERDRQRYIARGDED